MSHWQAQLGAEREYYRQKIEEFATIIPSAELNEFEGETFGDTVKTAEEYREELLTLLTNPQTDSGVSVPWRNVKFKLRPAEFTVWSGINGHGKSLVLTQVMLAAMRQGQRAVIASLELHPLQTLKRMACQTACVAWDELTELSVGKFFDAFGEKLQMYTEVGDMETHRVLALCRWCHANVVDHVVIDSLMKCGTLEQDYAAEKKFINSLQNIAKNTGVHVHLVAHARKGRDEMDMPGKFDVSGTAHITNLPDNVVTIARNKGKEQKLMKNPHDEKALDEPDAWINVCKQRHGDWEGVSPLWFHKSGLFSDSETFRPMA